MLRVLFVCCAVLGGSSAHAGLIFEDGKTNGFGGPWYTYLGGEPQPVSLRIYQGVFGPLLSETAISAGTTISFTSGDAFDHLVTVLTTEADHDAKFGALGLFIHHTGYEGFDLFRPIYEDLLLAPFGGRQIDEITFTLDSWDTTDEPPPEARTTFIGYTVRVYGPGDPIVYPPVATAPEPGTLGLLALGGLGLVAGRFRMGRRLHKASHLGPK